VTSPSTQLIIKQDNKTNEPLAASFEIKNVGSRDLIIYSAVPSCGCSVVTFTNVIHPGDNGTVEVSLTRSKIFPGRHGIELQTNDPGHKAPILEINVVADRVVTITPEDFVNFGNASLIGGSVQKRILASRIDGFAPQIVEVSNDLVEATLAKSGSVAGGFDLTMRLNASQNPGPFRATVDVKTGLVDLPEIAIPVSGVLVEQKARRR
jgi:hypothetical protein